MDIKKGDRVTLTCGGRSYTGKVILCSPNRMSLSVELDEGLQTTSGGFYANGLALLQSADGQYRELYGEVIEIAVAQSTAI